MAFDRKQFHDLTRTVLMDAGLFSIDGLDQTLGTIAKESHFGTYLRQVGGGPALGVGQMEPATFEWLQGKYRTRFPQLRLRTAGELVWDLRLAILMTRLRYYAVPEPIPSDLEGQARYWKKWYNTEKGAGTVAQYIECYDRYVRKIVRADRTIT